ncbi:MAG: hypothetical protein VZS44_07115 [Bacilli bacterium]|nr:hypothetical protein [Bacilli bacterium]
MIIDKKNLKEITVNVDNSEIEELLNTWCIDNYKLFGSILHNIESIGNRIILINYNKDDNSFITFDSKANPISISLLIDDDKEKTRRMIINKYDDIHEYLVYNNSDNIYIDEINKKNTKKLNLHISGKKE